MTSKQPQLGLLIIYRNLLQDELVRQMQAILSGQSTAEVQCQFIGELIAKAEQLGLQGNLPKNYLQYLIARDENVFSLACERTNGQASASLFAAVVADLKVIRRVLDADFSAYMDTSLIDDYTSTVVWSGQAAYYQLFADAAPEAAAKRLADHYARHGCGYMAGFAAFRWDSEAGLVGIKNFDPIRLSDLVGYERQKRILIDNTKALLAGKPANNALLHGSRGTGKSSSVKALVNEFYGDGLRLVEVVKQDLKDLAKIMELLRAHGQKFLIYLDDLSFEDFEVEYKYLKSAIEGGVEARPANVLIYATSNRRHLIKENWSDRSGDPDEIHRFDTVNEKISLSDRFGISLFFETPNQAEYLAIVNELVQKHRLAIPEDALRMEALRWESNHNGRSGRTAQQFINHLLGRD